MCPPNCTDTISRTGVVARRTWPGAAIGIGILLGDQLGMAAAFLREWLHRRRYRAYLAAMDDRGLRDIGLTRGDAEREAERPFWEASGLDESSRGRVSRRRGAP